MRTYAGIDLHSSNCYLAVIDEQQRRLFSKRLPNSLDHILSALQPFKEELSGVVVESTYNWYWLVDGLQENGYQMHLANPSAIQQYEGLKHTDDKWDAFWLAQLLKLGILPEGLYLPQGRASGAGSVASPAVVRASPNGAHSQFAEHGAALLWSWDLSQRNQETDVTGSLRDVFRSPAGVNGALPGGDHRFFNPTDSSH
jgi:hypothetical protein